MRVAVRPLPRHAGYAHIEIDLTRQVLFIVDAAGSVTHILPVCTGNEKTYVDLHLLKRDQSVARTAVEIAVDRSSPVSKV